MANVKITKRSVDAATPGDKTIFLWDTELKGFGLKITTSGSRIYIFQYRTGGREAKTKRVTIGAHGSPWTADLARNHAKELSFGVHKGDDPRELDQQRRRDAVDLAFDKYAEEFINQYLKQNWKETWQEATRILRRDVIPVLRSRPLPSITKNHITDLLNGLNDRPALKRQTYAVMKKLFNWASKSRSDLPKSPMADMDSVPSVPSRERALAPEEISAFLLATDAMPYPFGPYYQILATTMQRTSTVANMDWRQINYNEQQWQIPARIIKMKSDVLCPLSIEVERALLKLDRKQAGLVFTTTGTTPVSGISKAKSTLDKKMIEILRQRAAARGEDLSDVLDHEVLPTWRNHDLRRTGATILQSCGVPLEVTEELLAHKSGTRGGIAGVYNKHRYLVESGVALNIWAEYLNELRSSLQATMPKRPTLYWDRMRAISLEG